MWGLFTSSGAPQKSYYAFLAFRQLLDCPRRVAVASASDAGITAIAGLSKEGKTLRVLISNTTSETRKVKLQWNALPWKNALYERRTVDARRELQTVRNARVGGSGAFLTEEIEGPSVNLLTISADQ